MSELFTDIPYYDADMPIDNEREYALERCKLDVYTPSRNGRHPVVVFYHGGGMTGGGKCIPDNLMNSGLVVVAANYRFSGERAKCPDYINDAAAALAWTFRHIAEYGGDASKITITGASAGAYLAAMIGMDSQWLARFGCNNRDIFLIAPISGQMTTHFQIINERLGTKQNIPDHAVIDEFAPIWHAAKELPPIALYTGDLDLDWPSRPQENLLLAATLKNIKGHADATCVNIPGFCHGDVYPTAYLLIKKKIESLLAN